jgi:hypothetical protein
MAAVTLVSCDGGWNERLAGMSGARRFARGLIWRIFLKIWRGIMGLQNAAGALVLFV